MNLYPWAMLALGLLFGGAVMKIYHERKEKDLREELINLRVALGDLVRACEGDTYTLGSEPINKALKQAHEALER